MRNILNEVIEAVLQQYCNVVFTTNYRGGDHEFCLGKTADIDIEDLSAQLRKDTGYRLQIEAIKHVKDDYGFSYGCPTFCHASKLVGTTKKFNEFDNYNLFVINSIETEKGYKATWFAPLGDIDEKTFNILKVSAFNLIKQEAKLSCERYVDRMFEQAAEIKRQQKIVEKIGCHATLKADRPREWGYQGMYHYIIDAEEEITAEQAKEVIKVYKGEDALEIKETPMGYTPMQNKITSHGYGDKSSRWFWFHDEGTCD